MNRWWTILAVLCIASGAAAGNADITADARSAYVWRGITLNDGPVLQPSVDLSVPGGFGVNFWGNFDLDDYAGAFQKHEFSEVDVTVSYEFQPISWMQCGIGWIEYLFPHTGDTNGAAAGTREIYFEVNSLEMNGLTATFTVYVDVDEVQDVYAMFAIEYARQLSENCMGTVGASAGYAGKDMAAGGTSGLHDYNITAGATWNLTEAFEASAVLTYTDTLDTDVLPHQDVNLHGGASLSYAF